MKDWLLALIAAVGCLWLVLWTAYILVSMFYG